MRALDRLAEMKGKFGREAASTTAELLERLQRTRLRDPESLIRLHETVLFLRAYPKSPRVLRLADQILFSFGERIRHSEAFEDPEISGIAGTSVSSNFSYEIARSLVRRYGRSIDIDWDNYDRSDRLGPVLARLIPLSADEWSVEPHVDWRQWFERTRRNIRWLIDSVDPLVYDLLEVPLHWDLGDSAATRSRTRIPRKEIFYHHGPLLTRREVALTGGPKLIVNRVRRPEKILDAIVDTSVVRYRELWGFVHPDTAHVYHTDLGRSVDVYFFGLAAKFRLPVRAYQCGMFFKNGVPLGYVEGLSTGKRMELGFNLYYTFREGETAWLYVRLLKLFRERFGMTSFLIDPYQLGHENEEAIQSGAFWFYRKLGFRSTSKEVERLIAKEESRIAANPAHRSSPAMLRRFARAALIGGAG